MNASPQDAQVVKNLTRSRTRLRPATAADGDAVMEILRSSADWYAPLVQPEDMDQHDVGSGWYRSNLQRREFFVLELEGDVVGVLTLQDTGHHLYLGYVYLHADQVGQGLGRTLLERARDEGRRRNKRGLVLIAHPEASWAVRAYEKFGFTCIADEPDQVVAWNDGWLAPYYEDGFSLFHYTLDDDDLC